MTRKQDYINTYFIFAGIYFARVDLGYALWQFVQCTFVTLTLTTGQAMRRGLEGEGKGNEWTQTQEGSSEQHNHAGR